MLKTIFILLILITTFTVSLHFPKKTSGITSCTGGQVRATDLIISPSISGSFSTSSGKCVIDPNKAPFLPFKVPGYDDLKSYYYDQAQSTDKIIKHDPIVISEVNESSVDLRGNKEHLYYINGNLTRQNGTSFLQEALDENKKIGVVFVEGDFSIQGDIGYTGGLVFIVRGNVYIAPTVTQIDAIIISSGIIYTAADRGSSCSKADTVRALTLTINGSLISLNPDEEIRFCRKVFSATAQPGEVINHQPKYLVLLRNIYSDTVQKWSEISSDTPVPSFNPSFPSFPTPLPSSSSPPPGSDASPVPMPSGLVAYYKMDEASWHGTTGEVIDSSGGNNHGTAKNAATTASGKFGNAGVFDGSNYVDLGAPSVIDFDRSSAYSLTAWIKTTSSTLGSIIARMDPANNYRGYDMLYCGNAAECAYSLKAYVINTWTPNALANAVIPAGLKVNDGNWHHAALTYDGSSATGGLKIYIDGLRQNTSVSANSLTASARPSVNWRIASRNNADYFAGQIDEVRIYNRAITDEEVRVLFYNIPEPPPVPFTNPTIIDNLIQIINSISI